MQNTVLIIHVVVGILFSIIVLMQDKGVGFGTAVGGAGGGQVFTTKRGAAKVLHNLSVILAILFLLSAVVFVVVPAGEISLPEASITSDALPATDSPVSASITTEEGEVSEITPEIDSINVPVSNEELTTE
jgi:protein translocase SecG subunit